MNPGPSTSASGQESQGPEPKRDLALGAFKCKEPGCEKSYKKPSQLVAHMRWHDEERANVRNIPVSEKRLTKTEALRRYRKTRKGGEAYVCDICKKSFSRSDSLKEHKKIHSRVAHQSGPKLPEQHPNLSHTTMPGPVVTATDTRNTAKSARYSTVTHSGLSLSKRLALPATGARRPSRLPPAPVPEQQGLHDAPSRVDAPYKCEIAGCGRSYRRPFELQAHTRWHNKNGKYVCKSPGCEMRFMHALAFRRHKHTHTGEKPYECHVCKRMFSRADYLKNHKKTHSGVKDVIYGAFKCDEPGCKKSYGRPSELLTHKRWHDKEGRFVCTFSGCEKRFEYLENLVRHKRIHTGEKPYECDVCKKCFSRSDRLKSHKEIHS